MMPIAPSRNDEPSLIREVENDPVLRIFLDSIVDQAVFTVDPQGFIKTWSEGCRRLYGHTEEQAMGQNFSSLYTSEDRKRGHPQDNLRKSLKDGRYQEERMRLRKGSIPFMAEVSIFPIEVNGQLAGFAKVVRDVSERKRLEAERNDFKDKLERSNVELEGFCFALAHDLRTPIRAIVSKCRIIQQDLAPSLTEEDGAHLEAMATSSLRLAQLVDDLLEFAKFGQSELKRQEIDASELARSLAAEIQPHCQTGTAQFHVQEGVRASADPTMLEFILRNLFENSCKYSKANVTVSFGMDGSGGQPVYYVRDDGIGFDMQYQAKLFEPFQRLHRNDAFKGTGIGLASVKRLVSRHGGRVWAESQEDKGATFFFTLHDGTTPPVPID